MARTCCGEGRRRLTAKIARVRALAAEAPRTHPFEMFDFGLRRRYGAAWQREVVQTFAAQAPQWFKGTSNVLLARDLQLVPIGTMAHEYLQSYQALGVRLRDFQKAALEDWVQEYRGDLGIALTDTVGMDAFPSRISTCTSPSFFDGLRHDSGDPVAWGEKALAHYARLRIDAHGKRLVFSDGARRGARAGAPPPLRRPCAAGLRHRHAAQQRPGAAPAQHRHENRACQWPAGCETVRQPGQDAVRR